MTNEEATKIISENAVPSFPLKVESEDWNVAKDMAIEALDKQARVPKVGEQLKFFDDGKIKPSRMYDVTIVEVIPCRKIWFAKTVNGFKVKKFWKKEVEVHNSIDLYSHKTDYFIIGECKEYDKDPLVFVRDTDGEWFSIDWIHWWMSGLLDVDGSNYGKMLEWYVLDEDGWRWREDND